MNGRQALKDIIANRIVIRNGLNPQQVIDIPELYSKQIKAIDNELEVLDVLKKYIKIEIKPSGMFGTKGFSMIVNNNVFGQKEITEEEYSLIKGWLENEC